jgi:release factor glutamine methyltransferase
MRIEYTIQKALQEAKAKSIDLLDAELLLAYVLDTTRTNIVSRPETLINAEEVMRYQMMLERRQHHEPVAYILGSKEFWSLEFCVTEDVLIPRPETECLVEVVIESIPLEKAIDVLELGTGSGAISCAIAKDRPNVNITATDISSAALGIARQNMTAQGHKNVALLKSNWFEALGGKRFDVIVSNPPYLAEDDSHLIGDILFEPRQALVAGKTGVEAYEKIIAQAPNYLKPEGLIVLEHGYNQEKAVTSLLDSYGFTNIVTSNDYANIPRLTAARIA